MRELDLAFDRGIFEFTISDLIRSISFAIDEIEIVEIVFNELFIFIIAMSEHNDVILFNYK